MDYQAEVRTIYLNQGLTEKKKSGGASVRITKSDIFVTGKDFAGIFQMKIGLTSIKSIEQHVVYIDGLRRSNKNFLDIQALIDGSVWHIGLKVKDTQALFNAIQSVTATVF